MAHEIADFHRGGADAAGDRRANGAVAELHFQIVEQRAVDRLACEMSAWVLALSRLTVGVAFLGDEVGIARDVALRLLELGLRAGDGSLDALIWASIARPSSVKSTSPCLTRAPSRK